MGNYGDAKLVENLKKHRIILFDVLIKDKK
jgi:hypothetical protein